MNYIKIFVYQHLFYQKFKNLIELIPKIVFVLFTEDALTGSDVAASIETLLCVDNIF